MMHSETDRHEAGTAAREFGQSVLVLQGGGALGAEEDVGLGDLEVAGLHQLLLHEVLNLLDVHE